MALWEDESLFGKDTVSKYFKDLLTIKLPVFQDTIQLDKLWVYLRQYKVVNLNDQKRIKVESRFLLFDECGGGGSVVVYETVRYVCMYVLY